MRNKQKLNGLADLIGRNIESTLALAINIVQDMPHLSVSNVFQVGEKEWAYTLLVVDSSHDMYDDIVSRKKEAA